MRNLRSARHRCEAGQVTSVVWVDAWQMECCGEPFSVGGRVAWTMRSVERPSLYEDLLGPDLAGRLTHHEEHHGGVPEDAAVVRGGVRAITAVLGAYGSQNGPPTVNELVQRWRADPAEEPSRRLVGYVVELEVD